MALDFRGAEDLRFKFASWNLNRRRNTSIHGDVRLEILRSLKVDLLALQEVSRSFCALLNYHELFAWSDYSLEDSNTRPDGCALFGTSIFKLISSHVMKNVPFPEQTMICQLESAAGPLTACSFHIPNGSNHGIRHGDKKRISGKAIAELLGRQRSRTVFGIDANSPKVDHPEPLSVDFDE